MRNLKTENIFELNHMIIMMIVLSLLGYFFSTEFVTSFSQNLVKTTGAVYLCFFIIYTFIVLYRFMEKKKLKLTLKEVLLTLLFLVGIYDLALLIDRILVLTDRDLDAFSSNTITYILIFSFIVFQKFIFRKEIG